jgi:hypothetical protein
MSACFACKRAIEAGPGYRPLCDRGYRHPCGAHRHNGHLSAYDSFPFADDEKVAYDLVVTHWRTCAVCLSWQQRKTDADAAYRSALLGRTDWDTVKRLKAELDAMDAECGIE